MFVIVGIAKKYVGPDALVRVGEQGSPEFATSEICQVLPGRAGGDTRSCGDRGGYY